MEVFIKEFIVTVSIGAIFVEIFRASGNLQYAKMMKMAYVSLAGVPFLGAINYAIDSSVVLKISNIIVNVFSILKTLAEKAFG